MSAESADSRSRNEQEGVYRQNIEMIRSSIRDGVKFDVACEFITTPDQDLKNMIVDDALKIEIAEFHYGEGRPLIDVAKKLGIPMERVLKANEEMLEDIMETGNEAAK